MVSWRRAPLCARLTGCTPLAAGSSRWQRALRKWIMFPLSSPYSQLPAPPGARAAFGSPAVNAAVASASLDVAALIRRHGSSRPSLPPSLSTLEGKPRTSSTKPRRQTAAEPAERKVSTFKIHSETPTVAATDPDTRDRLAQRRERTLAARAARRRELQESQKASTDRALREANSAPVVSRSPCSIGTTA